MNKNKKPTWWVCYLIHSVLIGLMLLNYATPMPDTWHQVFACATVCGCYGLVAWWLHVNRGALAREDWEKQQQPRTSPDRDVPLSPVQARYLRAMKRYTSKNQ